MSGSFRDLEDELVAFTTNGYTGDNSPNRADALVWAMTDLFGEIVAVKKKKQRPRSPGYDPVDDAVGY